MPRVAEEFVGMLSADLVATLGWATEDAERLARSQARRLADLDADRIWIAEEVQQRLHDTFIDTSWPACPDHHVHPLWLEEHQGDLVWTCQAAGRRLCRLGQLGTIISVES